MVKNNRDIRATIVTRKLDLKNKISRAEAEIEKAQEEYANYADYEIEFLKRRVHILEYEVEQLKAKKPRPKKVKLKEASQFD